jgi:DMSO/TMAO reductase YedYZ molybdopterin-dependent catalytic subunit
MHQDNAALSGNDDSLPPGQHLASGFLRYGTHLSRRVPEDASGADVISVTRGGATLAEVTHEQLRSMGRQEMTADFHCVAGWSVRGLRWSGVPLRVFYEAVVRPLSEERVTHLRFVCTDGFRSVLRLDDALEPDVMVADHVDGRPLGESHGGPVRLVCPTRYGYKSAKHLRRIELHGVEPSEGHENRALDTVLKLIKPHPTARVANEERHRYLPPQAVRTVYFRVLHPVFRYLSGLGDRELP